MRTEISAAQLGAIASQSFSKAKSGTIGHVIASFQNSFYIRTYADELIFITNRPLESPITVNVTSNFNFEKLALTNSSVTLREDQILIGDLAIRMETVQPHERPTKSLLDTKLRIDRNALRRVVFIIGILDVSLSVLDAKGISHEQTRKFARTSATALRDSFSLETFMHEALALVGLGAGFTPSGDDLLGGFLATWNSLAEVVDRSKVVLDFGLLSDRTSWISAKLLDYMQRELLDAQLSHAILSAALDNEDEFVLAVEALIPRGHTSGLDISTGMIIALSLILDIANNTLYTETLLNQLGL